MTRTSDYAGKTKQAAPEQNGVPVATGVVLRSQDSAHAKMLTLVEEHMNRGKTAAKVLVMVGLGLILVQIDTVRADLNFDLVMAALNGDVVSAKELTAKGAAINHSCGGLTPLIAAAASGHLEVAKHLIAGGANVNGKSDQGPSALMQASAKGHIALVRLLIEHGADVNAKASYIWIELPLTGEDCVDLEKLSAVEELCAREKCCMTALCVAANPEIAELLKQHGATE